MRDVNPRAPALSPMPRLASRRETPTSLQSPSPFRYNPFLRPTNAANFWPVSKRLSCGGFAILLVALIGLLGCPLNAGAQNASQASAPPSASASSSIPASSLPDQPADVIALIIPGPGDTAQVGLAYRRQVPHDRVRQDIARLLKATGWQLAGSPVIEDDRLQHKRPRLYPLTTGAQFSLRQAPQVRENAPALLPYLQAFQAYDQVEVMFALPEITPYRGVTDFDSAALKVGLAQEKESGVYRYEAAIRDHVNPLPSLPATRPASGAGSEKETAAGRAATAHAASNLPYRIGLILLITGSLLSLGAYAYLSRRQALNLPARTLRH